MAAALALPGVDVFVDTLADIDRGYFVHTSLVDRRYTLRLAGQVVRNLYAELNVDGVDSGGLSPGSIHALEGGKICSLRQRDASLLLVLPEPAASLHSLPGDLDLSGARGRARWVDLSSGAATQLEWRRDAAAGAILLDEAQRCTVPALLVLGDVKN
jgi:hypothetical protein